MSNKLAPAPIERVILQEEVKLWRARTELMYFDSDVYDLTDSSIELASPMPVFTDTMRQIGFASVALVEASLLYSSPRRRPGA